MEASAVSARRARRVVARILAFVWATFWIWYGVRAGMIQHRGLISLFIHALPGLFFLCVAFFALRWNTAGGIALIAAGMILLITYPLWAIIRISVEALLMEEALLVVPPILAGALMLFNGSVGPVEDGDDELKPR